MCFNGVWKVINLDFSFLKDIMDNLKLDLLFNAVIPSTLAVLLLIIKFYFAKISSEICKVVCV